MPSRNEEVVGRFFEAWKRLDLDGIVDFFTEDAVYHNIPMKPAVGRHEIRKLIAALLNGTSSFEIQVLHCATTGSVVFNERVDSSVVNGKKCALPIAGVFEVTADGKLKAWRDYFDMEMFKSQLR